MSIGIGEVGTLSEPPWSPRDPHGLPLTLIAAGIVACVALLAGVFRTKVAACRKASSGIELAAASSG